MAGVYIALSRCGDIYCISWTYLRILRTCPRVWCVLHGLEPGAVSGPHPTSQARMRYLPPTSDVGGPFQGPPELGASSPCVRKLSIALLPVTHATIFKHIMTRAPTSFSSSILTTAVTYFILPAAFLFLLSPHMASLLRALVAGPFNRPQYSPSSPPAQAPANTPRGPRLKHEESDLDLCYVSSSSPCIIAMSVPAHSYPRKAYRNPVESVLAYLDRKHGPQNWRIWEFRAEGAGYEDSVFRNQIEHAPFPDHHPPPFEVIPRAMGSMRNWLAGDAGEWDKKDDQQKPERVIVVHCKGTYGFPWGMNEVR